MREHIGVVQKGNDVRAEFVGKQVTWQKATSVDEALSAGHFENEGALVAAAEAQRDIAIRAGIRTILGKPDGTMSKAQDYAGTVKVGAPRVSNGAVGSGPKTAKGRVTKAAQVVGNKMFDRAIADPTWAAKAIKLGAFEQSDLDRYVADIEAAKVEAQAAKKAAEVDARLAEQPVAEPVQG